MAFRFMNFITPLISYSVAYQRIFGVQLRHFSTLPLSPKRRVFSRGDVFSDEASSLFFLSSRTENSLRLHVM